MAVRSALPLLLLPLLFLWNPVANIGGGTGGGGAASPITASFVSSRTAGMIPLCVTFEASGTTHTDTMEEFHDLHYSWNFDDAGAGTWTHSGLSKETELGPVAGHCFESVGTHTVVLTVTDDDGDTDTAQQVITTYAQDDATNGCTDVETFCYANTAGTFQGCPLDTNTDGTCDVQAGNCYVIPATSDPGAQFNTNSASNTCHYWAVDDTWDQTTAFDLGADTGPSLFGSFGTGAKPRFHQAGGNHFISSDDAEDWRFVDIVVEDDTGATGGDGWDLECPNDHFTFLRIEAYDKSRSIVSTCNNAGEDDIHWGWSTVDTVQVADNLTVGWMIFWSAEMAFEAGNTYRTITHSGGGIRRMMHYRWAKMAHNHMTTATSGGNENVTIRSCGTTTLWCNPAVPSEYINISDNISHSRNTGGARQGHWQHASSDQFTPKRDMIYERNLATTERDTNDNGALTMLANSSCGERVTLRNNVINCDDQDGVGPHTWGACRLVFQTSGGSCNNDDLRVYNNTIFTEDMTSGTTQPGFTDGGTGHICRSNLVYAPNTGGSNQNCSTATNSNNLEEGGTGAGQYTGNPFCTACVTGERDTRAEFELLAAGTITGGTDPVDNGYDFSAADDEGLYVDLSQTTRPDNSAFDVGADEYTP